MTNLQFKVSRRISENVWTHKKLTSKQSTLIWKFKRKSNKKQSDFATQLQQRTKLSLSYGRLPIPKIQHNRTYTYLNKQKSLLFHLETRLDVILVRANFCSTLFAARQYIIHGYFCVNFQTVTVPAFSVSNGDIISLSSPHYFDCMKAVISQNQLNNRIVRTKASHLEVSYRALNIVLLYEPSQIHFHYKIELDLI